MSSPNGNRRSRAEANEEAFKAHNERRAEIEERAGVWDDEPVPFACECDNPACGRAIMMTVADYERAAGPHDQFIVLPGHVDPAAEVIVEEHDTYLVVSKPGLRRPGRPEA